jgi:hypothetical protein
MRFPAPIDKYSAFGDLGQRPLSAIVPLMKSEFPRQVKNYAEKCRCAGMGSRIK